MCLTILLNLRSFTNCPRIMNKCLVNSSQLATIFGIVYRVTDCHAHPERSFDLCEVPAIIWYNFTQKILKRSSNLRQKQLETDIILATEN